MILAVDASAVAAVVFGEPEADEMANYFEDETLVAPALIDFELANVGLKKLRRRPEQAADIIAALKRAAGMRIDRVAVSPVEVLKLAAQTGLSVYDAAYLCVAISKDAELVTLEIGRAHV